jgi:hypothetical protein
MLFQFLDYIGTMDWARSHYHNIPHSFQSIEEATKVVFVSIFSFALLFYLSFSKYSLRICQQDNRLALYTNQAEMAAALGIDWSQRASFLIELSPLNTKTILSKIHVQEPKSAGRTTSTIEKGKAALFALILTVLIVFFVIILPILILLICLCFRDVDRQADTQESIYNRQQYRSRPTGASREPKNDDWDSDVKLGLRLTTVNLLLLSWLPSPEVGFLARLTLWADYVFCTRR